LGILRQINEADLEDRITGFVLDFSYESTPYASMELLFPDEPIAGNFRRCLQENGIPDISLPDSGVFIEASHGEIDSVNKFVNDKVAK
jgi:hypothetical protein